MLVLSVLALVFVLPTVVTGRIPLLNGVVGGVGSSYLSKVKTLRETVDANTPARTPGKLRVVENSGICGKCSLFRTLSCSQFWQKLRHMSIKPLDMVTSLRTRASGLCCTSRFPFRFLRTFHRQVLVFCCAQESRNCSPHHMVQWRCEWR